MMNALITTEKGFWHVCFTLHACCLSQDLVTTMKNPVLCLVVLRLAVVFLEEIWKTIQRNP